MYHVFSMLVDAKNVINLTKMNAYNHLAFLTLQLTIDKNSVSKIRTVPLFYCELATKCLYNLLLISKFKSYKL